MQCELCQRNVVKFNQHHLIPRTCHKNKKVKNLSKNHLQKTINICYPCHGQIHSVIHEKDLAFKFNTIEKLIAHPEINKFINWIKNKPSNKEKK